MAIMYLPKYFYGRYLLKQATFKIHIYAKDYFILSTWR